MDKEKGHNGLVAEKKHERKKFQRWIGRYFFRFSFIFCILHM